jgi:hypothetical protein
VEFEVEVSELLSPEQIKSMDTGLEQGYLASEGNIRFKKFHSFCSCILCVLGLHDNLSADFSVFYTSLNLQYGVGSLRYLYRNSFYNAIW